MSIITTQDLVDQVRSMLDEENRANVTDEGDILPALNRAQDYASNILSRHYESPLVAYKSIGLNAGQNEYDIPEDALEQRLEKVEVYLTQVYYPVRRLDYRDVTLYETPSKTNVPYYYTVIGTKFRLIPTPTSSYSLRIWYLKEPPKLVAPQGRITLINSGSNYVILDAAGSDLSTDLTSLDSYVNLIDAQTGNVKATMQVQSVQGNKITFKSSPTRSSVQGRDVSSSLPSALEQDDYICLAQGSCVPFFKKPFTNFLIQYAVAEIQRKLGGPADIEQQVLKGLEQQVERSWVGREVSTRVQKVSKQWSVPGRRYFNNN
jgi:hypothetical protein